jgi:hypothetical protein
MLRNRKTLAVALVTALLTAALVSSGGPASAAPPGNDTQAGAVDFSGVPFHYTQDTTEATVDAGESVARDYCLGIGAPAFEHAVWFKTTVSAGGGTDAVVLDVTQSDFGAGMAVLQDTGSGLSALACVPGTYLVPGGGSVPPGTYYVVVFGDGTTAATSGNLVFDVSIAPPPPEVSFTIDPVGSATKQGGAWISGTVSCSGGGSNAQLLFIEGQVTQTVGRLIISSYFFESPFVLCDGVAYAWRAYAPPTNGKFAGGKAAAVSFTVACGSVQCTEAYAEATVKLNRAAR